MHDVSCFSSPLCLCLSLGTANEGQEYCNGVGFDLLHPYVPPSFPLPVPRCVMVILQSLLPAPPRSQPNKHGHQYLYKSTAVSMSSVYVKNLKSRLVQLGKAMISCIPAKGQLGLTHSLTLQMEQEALYSSHVEDLHMDKESGTQGLPQRSSNPPPFHGQKRRRTTLPPNPATLTSTPTTHTTASDRTHNLLQTMRTAE
jgi:hypothetical protein